MEKNDDVFFKDSVFLNNEQIKKEFLKTIDPTLGKKIVSHYFKDDTKELAKIFSEKDFEAQKIADIVQINEASQKEEEVSRLKYLFNLFSEENMNDEKAKYIFERTDMSTFNNLIGFFILYSEENEKVMHRSKEKMRLLKFSSILRSLGGQTWSKLMNIESIHRALFNAASFRSEDREKVRRYSKGLELFDPKGQLGNRVRLSSFY